MDSFATLDDLQRLWKRLQPSEIDRANALLATVSDMLRKRLVAMEKI